MCIPIHREHHPIAVKGSRTARDNEFEETWNSKKHTIFVSFDSVNLANLKGPPSNPVIGAAGKIGDRELRILVYNQNTLFPNSHSRKACGFTAAPLIRVEGGLQYL